MFGSIWQCFVTTQNSVQKQIELVQLMQKFVPRTRIGIFATNAPDPPHWTLNSCFGASRSIWMHLAIFHYYTKLGAKRVELVQLMHKFVPGSRIWIFCNKHTDPPHWILNTCIGAFRSVWVHLDFSLPCEGRCKTVWTGAINAKVCATKSHWNFSQRTHPIHPIRP